MSPDDYMSELRQRFPDLAPTLDEDEWRGLLHVETGRFAAFCREAIDAGDRDLVEKCFSFARRSAMDGTDEVQNAIGVSFVEHLNFQDGKVLRRWAYDLLPPRLKADAEALGVDPD